MMMLIRFCYDVYDVQLVMLFAPGEEERMGSWAMLMPKIELYLHF